MTGRKERRRRKGNERWRVRKMSEWKTSGISLRL